MLVTTVVNEVTTVEVASEVWVRELVVKNVFVAVSVTVVGIVIVVPAVVVTIGS